MARALKPVEPGFDRSRQLLIYFFAYVMLFDVSLRVTAAIAAMGVPAFA